MTHPSRSEVEAMAARADKATKGPWVWIAGVLQMAFPPGEMDSIIWPENATAPSGDQDAGSDEHWRHSLGACGPSAEPNAMTNAALIASMRTDLPRLAALALGFGDAMERALEIGDHGRSCSGAFPKGGQCDCWHSILRAALEGYRP